MKTGNLSMVHRNLLQVTVHASREQIQLLYNSHMRYGDHIICKCSEYTYPFDQDPDRIPKTDKNSS